MSARAVVLVLVASHMVQSCSTVPEKQLTAAVDEQPKTTEECSRFEAGLDGSVLLLESIPEFQQKALDDCGEGDMQACFSAPFIAPFTAIAGIFWIPFGFGIGVSSDEGQQAFCNQRSERGN